MLEFICIKIGEKKIKAQTYQAYRLFQGLPTKGQRTRANGNTPRHYNPFLAIGLDDSYYKEQQPVFKMLELSLNERTDELKAFKKAQEDNLKDRKKDRRQRQKERREEFIKKNKETSSLLKTKIRTKGRNLSRRMGRKKK